MKYGLSVLFVGLVIAPSAFASDASPPQRLVAASTPLSTAHSFWFPWSCVLQGTGYFSDLVMLQTRGLRYRKVACPLFHPTLRFRAPTVTRRRTRQAAITFT